jgi:hypothetical protein
VNQLVRGGVSKELFVGAPHQREAFPTVFEDDRFTYTIYGDEYSGVYKVHRDRQKMDADKWEYFRKRQVLRLQQLGFSMSAPPRAFVTLSRVVGVNFDPNHNSYYKVYCEEPEQLPLCLTLRKRDPLHYLNVNHRCQSIISTYKQDKEVICLNMHLFGLMGTVQSI